MLRNTEEAKIELTKQALVYLGPLRLTKVSQVKKKGLYGEYIYGYTILFSTEENGKELYVTLRKDDDLLAQITALLILRNPRSFVFEKKENGEIIAMPSLHEEKENSHDRRVS